MANTKSVREALADGRNLKVNGRLDGLSYKTDRRHLPIVSAGNFCTAIPYYDTSGRCVKMLRIWRRTLHGLNPSMQERSQMVMNYLRNSNLPYFVGCEYCGDVLEVKDETLQGFIMDYVAGNDLADYLNDICINTRYSASERKRHMQNLAANFRQMCMDLHLARIAHGDLSGSNIRVIDQDKLVLIDYDSICIPSLDGYANTTDGAGSFNHPRRKGMKMNLVIDHFAMIVIYLALLCLMKDPSLWQKYCGSTDAEEGQESFDSILFSEGNFKSYSSFVNSTIYRDIAGLSISDPSIKDMLNRLTQSLAISPESIPFPFDGVVKVGKTISPRESDSSGSTTIFRTKGTHPRMAVKMKARYCAECGWRFTADDQTYCGNCGARRKMVEPD